MFFKQMDNNAIFNVKKKKEFSKLPDSIISKALELNENDIKNTRAFLRKYFGVFLTNKIIKGKDIDVLKSHKSSTKRNYNSLYKKIFSYEKFNSVIDLGCGVNGFSYFYFPEKINYIGLEASGQLVNNMNNYFGKMKFIKAKSINKNLFEIKQTLKIIEKQEKPRLIFMFQIIDALEGFERNYSKNFLLELKNILGEKDKIVLSMPQKSLSSGLKKASGKWVFDFIKENFKVSEEFEMFDEKFVVFGKGKS